jgi:ABC-type Fe3+-siderophore transport system permease subunit
MMLAGQPPVETLAYFTGKKSLTLASARDTLATQIIQAPGGEKVFADSEVFPPVSPEAVAGKQIALLVLLVNSEASSTQAKPFLFIAFPNMKAGKDRRAIAIDQRCVAPGWRHAQTVKDLTRQLHPEVFNQMNAAPASVDRAQPRTSAERMNRRSRRVSRSGLSVLLMGLGAAVVGSVLLATGLGPVSVSETGQIVLLHLLPGAVIGAGLALAGCALQATVRNPLAEPYLLGISSGAAFGAVLMLVIGSAAVGGLSLSGAAFAGGLAAMVVVYVLAKRGGRVTPFRLVSRWRICSRRCMECCC